MLNHQTLDQLRALHLDCSRRLNIDPPGVRRKTWTGLCRKSKARSVFERTE